VARYIIGQGALANTQWEERAVCKGRLCLKDSCKKPASSGAWFPGLTMKARSGLMGLQAWSFFISQGQSAGLQQLQPFFGCPPSCPRGTIRSIPLANAATTGSVCISRKHKARNTMNVERHTDLIEVRKKNF
jgi:hypothetical protein